MMMKSASCRRPLCLAGALLLMGFLGACSSSQSIRGVPRNLPKIDLYGSAATPAHSMEKKEYPFDSNGDYMTSWAAMGGSAASGADIDRWKSSHGGSVSRKQPSPVKKVKSSSKGGSYTIKSGDTLSAIARRNNTTVAKLKAANGMKGDMIRAGKTLKIPR